jgi:hypothetical protein
LLLLSRQPHLPMLFTESAAYGQFYGGSGAHLAGFGDYIRGSLLELWWSRLMVGSPVAYPASGRCGSLRHGVSEADGQPAAVPVKEF